MSSFKTTFRHKKSGALVEVFCRDDYFAPREYGYFVDGIEAPMRYDEFYKLYELERKDD